MTTPQGRTLSAHQYPSRAPLLGPAYLWITDDAGAPIKGSSCVPGREGSIDVLDFQHGLRLHGIGIFDRFPRAGPYDPLIVIKAHDASTQHLFRAAQRRQKLAKVHVHWYKFDADGNEHVYFELHLERACVSHIRGSEATGSTDEEVEIHYQLIRQVVKEGVVLYRSTAAS